MAAYCRRIIAVVLAALIAIGATACGESSAELAFDDRVEPIVLEVARNFAETLPGPQGLIVKLGVYALEKTAQQQAEDADATYLLIDQTVDGQQQISAFRIDTQRKLRIDMNGHFIADIERNLITIRVDPDVASTIVITDAEADEPVFTGGRFVFDADHVNYDFDTGRFSDPDLDPEFASELDAVDPIVAGTYDSVTGGLAALRNGARSADWGDGTPTLAGCSAIPDSDWDNEEIVSALLTQNRWNRLHPVYCIQTSDGRYGTLTQRFANDEIETIHIEYILWSLPND